ncbi:hypothetical protein D3C87_2192450 [compost metagenome]
MKDRENYEKDLKRLYELSRDVSKTEQKAYAALYSKYAEEGNSPNPCRDFKL